MFYNEYLGCTLYAPKQSRPSAGSVGKSFVIVVCLSSVGQLPFHISASLHSITPSSLPLPFDD